MKTDARKTVKKHRTQSIRTQLVEYFILFAALLMMMLWLFQTLLLEQYYEKEMNKKMQAAVRTLAAQYAEDEDFDFEAYLHTVGEIANANDMYIYIEAENGVFAISSTDQPAAGRYYYDVRVVEDAKRRFSANGEDKAAFKLSSTSSELVTQVYATRVESPYRPSVRIYGFASLTPMGPAVGILTKQLVIVTGGSLVFAFFLALLLSKHISRPIINITQKASELSRGHYNVRFEGGNSLEVNDLAATLNAASVSLSRLEEMRRDLLANVSHDLRTPITMIKSYAEMIRDLSGDDRKKRNEHLDVIIDESDRLGYLVKNILTLSRIQGGVEQMEMKPTDLQRTAERIMSVYRVLEEQEGYTLQLSTVRESLIVRADVHRIERVLSNLISNAVRYSAERKVVEVAFSKRGHWARCEVRDTGPGIPEEDLTNIWNRYEKASTRGTRAKEGSGLGLSIAKEILERHGAQYGVSSTLGEGSIFWFELPVID